MIFDIYIWSIKHARKGWYIMKIISIVVCVVTLFSIFSVATPVLAVENTDIFKYKLNEDNASYTVTGITDTSVNAIIVPSEYNDLPVTAIGEYAFNSCRYATVVVIPEGITEINGGFHYLTRLRSITFPLSLVKIGNNAFMASTHNLKYIYYPGNAEQWSNIDIGQGNSFDITKDGVVFSPSPDCHITENVVISEATDVAPGRTINQCMVCGEILDETIHPQLLPYEPIFEVYNDADGVCIDWFAHEGPDYYHVYRRTSGTSWKKIGKVEGRGECNCYLECFCEEFADRILVDKDVKTGTTYYYTIKAENEVGFSTYNKTGIKIKYVQTPKLTKIANETKGVRISWKKVSGVDGYYIYRADITNNKTQAKREKIATIKKQSVQSYLDESAKAGRKYSYTVKAYDGKTLSANQKSGMQTIRLTTPKITSVVNGKSGVQVNWKKTSGAQEYIVYRKTAKTGWARLGTTTALTFVDTTAKNGSTYYYTVKAMAGNNFSAYNKGIKIKFISAPEFTKVANQANGIMVNWNKVSGVDGYYIYRRVSGTTSWSKIASIKKSSTTSYVDKKVSAGKTYDYAVKAYDGKTVSGRYPFVKITRLTVPALKTVKSGKDGITVTWSKVTNADGYYVYRKTANSSWVCVEKVEGVATLKFTDTSVEKGKTYIYTVRAFKGNDRSYYNTKGISVKY